MNIAPNRAKRTARRLAMTVVSVTGVAVVAACASSLNGSSNSPSPAASGNPASAAASASGIPCAQITALRSTLTDLSHTTVSPTSAGRIASDLTKAQQELAAVKGQATGPFATAANQLSGALNAIKTDASAIAKNPTTTNLTNLTNAVNTFKAV